MDSIAYHVAGILRHLESDSSREGLKDTPLRVEAAYEEIFSGYRQTPEQIMTVFEEPCDEMIICSDIEFYSTCEHHMLPFFGKAHIAYIPDGKVIGLSKLARLLDIYARRLQIQERISQQVTDALMQHLNPLGAGCVIEASHFCMMCRGVQKQNSKMITSSLVGVFQEAEVRQEFHRLIGK